MESVADLTGLTGLPLQNLAWGSSQPAETRQELKQKEPFKP